MKNRLFIFSLFLALLLNGCSFNFDTNDTADTGETGKTSDTSNTNFATPVFENMGSVAGAQVDYTINYDSSKWTAKPSDPTADTEYEFENVDGDIYAMVVAEKIEVPMDTLKEVVLQNAQSVAEDAEIVFEESRTVNGVDILAMKISGTVYGMQFMYYGYYYGGSAGTIQFITYTTTNLMDEYEQDLTDLLNGLALPLD